jgi:large conductance mechanosensitive channel
LNRLDRIEDGIFPDGPGIFFHFSANKLIFRSFHEQIEPVKSNPMGMWNDFKQFAFRGNVVELAVAVIIGAAFGSIVTSLVEDVITPLILSPALKAANVQDLEQLAWGSVRYGKFLSAVIGFLVVALVLFGIVQSAKRLEMHQPPPAAPSSTDQLLMEIRDALRK